MKRIRIAHACSRDWKANLHIYWFTLIPQIQQPVCLQWNFFILRKICTKLPDLHQLNAEDIEVRDHDSENKGKGKMKKEQEDHDGPISLT